MDKIKNFFLNFIKTRTVAYYIAAAATLIAWLAGVVASGALGFAGATAIPAVLVTLALILFVATSLVGQEKNRHGSRGGGKLWRVRCNVLRGFPLFPCGNSGAGHDRL